MTPSACDLPADATAPGRARASVRSWLGSSDLAALSETAVLLASELVTNAVLHAKAPLHLALAPAAAGLRIAVSDGSPVGPARRRHSREATTGRGLQLLVDLADDWGWERVGTGKVVWCIVSSATDPWAAVTDGAWLADAES